MSATTAPTPPAAGNGAIPANCTTGNCPPTDEIVLVELVESYADGTDVKTQPPAGRDQYINLDSRVDPGKPHPEYGRAIHLRARIAWKSGDTTRSLAGKNVYWYSVPDGGNKQGMTDAERESLFGAGNRKGPTQTDAQGWTQVISFMLSVYGGDKFDAFATVDSNYQGGLKAGTYTVWRKLWYQVTEMKNGRPGGSGKFDLTGGVTGPFEAGYKTVFMKFEEKLPRTEANWVGNLPTPASRADEAKKYFTADNLSPFKCHIMTVDYSEPHSKQLLITPPAIKAPAYETGENLLWPHGAGTTPWKTSATYVPSGGGAPINIPDDKMTLVANPARTGYKNLKIDLSFIVPPPSVAKPVQLRLDLVAVDPTAWGWGGGSYHLYLCSGLLHDMTPTSDWEPIQRSDCVHEIGHALGLVNLTPTPAGSMTWEDHAHPNHCNKLKTECAMYYESGTDRPTTFHLAGGIGCHDSLRRQQFNRTVMGGYWKD